MSIYCFFSPFHSRIDALSFAHACMGLEKRDALGGRLMGCISVLFVITSALLCIGLPWNVHRIVIMRSLLILCVSSRLSCVSFFQLCVMDMIVDKRILEASGRYISP
jgi:hypothetical protein